MQIGNDFLHGRHTTAEIATFETGGYRHVALQVLAPDLGLSRQVGDRRQRAECRGLSGRADQQRVLYGVHRRARRLRETYADGVGAVVQHHRRRRRLALQDSAGIQLHLLRRETRRAPTTAGST